VAADTSEVQIRLPPDIFGGDPSGLIEYLGLQGRHIADDRWSVKVRDLRGQDLLSVYTLADESGRAHRFDLLDLVPNAEPIINAEIASRVNEVRDRLIQRATSGSGDPAAPFHLIQLNIILAGRQELNQVVADAYAYIGKMPLETTGEPGFTNRSAHLIRVSDVLIRRVRVPGIMFRFDQDPDAMKTFFAVRGGRSGSEHYFGSGADWYENVIGMSHYLGPLLGSITPRFWCFQSLRELSVILLSLGMDLNGFRTEPAEMMQLLPVSGPVERTACQLHLHRSSCADAIDWWVMRLNQMFGYLSDPTTFKDASGAYAAHETTIGC
jgi:hypothetical protein